MAANPLAANNVGDLAAQLAAGERRALAKAITLLESQKPGDDVDARALLDLLLPRTGQSLRIGISGVPGVGKSTFIESFGSQLIELGHRVAVLAVDPSSTLSGGSILGDKTRMEHLSTNPAAFIRPSPTSGALGGVAARSRETILLCEAAGYDIVLVETVGVGQSETAVAGMTDVFVVLQLPNAGDELQAIKKGVLELADIVVVNKADLDANAAANAARHLQNALHLLRPRVSGWAPPVLTLSALTGAGIAPLWQQIELHQSSMRHCGEFAANRRRQALHWMRQLVNEGLTQRFQQSVRVQCAESDIAEQVAAGKLSANAAAAQLLQLFDQTQDNAGKT